jgi:glutamate racemase
LKEPIAILDSGVGGLTVTHEIIRQLPREEIVYFGDTARCPYGSRSKEEVKEYSYQMIRFLEQFKPKMLVIACNTATAVILEELRATSAIPVIGVIHPGVRTAIKATLTGRVGIIGTANTINSQLYEQALKQIHPELYVKSLACPSLVPLVEEGRFEHEDAFEIVKKELYPLTLEDIDTLILGCTHYPLLAPVIQRVLGDHVRLISSADETAREISTILFHKNMLSQTFGRPKHKFFTSGKTAMFRQIAESWLKCSIEVEHIQFD